VVFVPAAQLAAVLDLAERIAAREQAMIEAVRGGRSIVDVMHDSQFPAVEATP
jgi:4-hydroxy-4-methyl-2-oxoglutarate aldolase